MARTWTCLDCPATGVQTNGGILRRRCEVCRREQKRIGAANHYAKNTDDVLARQRARRKRSDEYLAKRRAKRHKNSPSGFIYLLEAVGTNTFKIGFSATEEGIKKRIVGCQTGNAFLIEHRGTIRGTRMDEADLHLMLKDDRMAGEWFMLSPALRKISRERFGCSLRKKTLKLVA